MWRFTHSFLTHLFPSPLSAVELTRHDIPLSWFLRAAPTTHRAEQERTANLNMIHKTTLHKRYANSQIFPALVLSIGKISTTSPKRMNSESEEKHRCALTRVFRWQVPTKQNSISNSLRKDAGKKLKQGGAGKAMSPWEEVEGNELTDSFSFGRAGLSNRAAEELGFLSCGRVWFASVLLRFGTWGVMLAVAYSACGSAGVLIGESGYRKSPTRFQRVPPRRGAYAYLLLISTVQNELFLIIAYD